MALARPPFTPLPFPLSHRLALFALPEEWSAAAVSVHIAAPAEGMDDGSGSELTHGSGYGALGEGAFIVGTDGPEALDGTPCDDEISSSGSTRWT